MSRASEHGLCVSKPWGDSSRYDFVVEHAVARGPFGPAPDALVFYNFELVIDRENSRDAVSTDKGNVSVCFVIDYPLQRDMAIDHNNADRLIHASTIFLQRRIAIDRAE